MTHRPGWRDAKSLGMAYWVRHAGKDTQHLPGGQEEGMKKSKPPGRGLDSEGTLWEDSFGYAMATIIPSRDAVVNESGLPSGDGEGSSVLQPPAPFLPALKGVDTAAASCRRKVAGERCVKEVTQGFRSTARDSRDFMNP